MEAKLPVVAGYNIGSGRTYERSKLQSAIDQYLNLSSRIVDTDQYDLDVNVETACATVNNLTIEDSGKITVDFDILASTPMGMILTSLIEVGIEVSLNSVMTGSVDEEFICSDLTLHKISLDMRN